MKKVNEIFYSIQGEGRNTGRAAVFVRFAGCNLKCPFCDTDFESFRLMTNEQIVEEITACPARLVVLTGGEPTLQADNELIDLLHGCGFEVAMETNGTHKPPKGIDWLTCSPKGNVVIDRCNELKCVFDGTTEPSDHGVLADYYYLQPCDVGDKRRNGMITQECARYIMEHPQWRLSLQTHKLAGFK